MIDRGSRLAIAASLAWVILAAFTILGTHVDVVAQLGTRDTATERAAEPTTLLAPSAVAPVVDEC